MTRLPIALILLVALVAAPSAWAQEPPPVPRILVTGDSMLLLTDRALKSALQPAGRATVISDIHIGTGLTKAYLFDWLRYAPKQMRRKKPDVVIAAMGGNESFAIGSAPCCGRSWRIAYRKRIERLSSLWRRGGAEHVYWMTLPAPVKSRLTRRFTAVNAAIEQAAGIGVIDTRPILTPDGVFVAEMETSPGVVEKIRSDDGVHIWHPGARLVAREMIARMEADGALAPPPPPER